MSKHYDGGPAHPTLPEHGFNQGEPGMTLRDYFAAKAMHSITVEQMSGDIPEEAMGEFWSLVARYSYMAADAMLQEREK